MADTTTDHAQAIRHALAMVGDHVRHSASMLDYVDHAKQHVDALAAERDALIRYAKTLEVEIGGVAKDRGLANPTVQRLMLDMRARHGVAHIMFGDRKGQ